MRENIDRIGRLNDNQMIRQSNQEGIKYFFTGLFMEIQYDTPIEIQITMFDLE